MQSVLTAIFDILCESAIYLLLGFALAGVIHVILRRTPRFAELLAAKSGRSVALAALLGAPIPLCSCGVVPAALTLRKNGASKGATVSFLISCPETDVVSLLLTYGLLGPVMAVFRPFAAVVTAIVAGSLTNLVDRDRPVDVPPATGADGSCKPESSEYDPQHGPLWSGLHYGFVRFFDDIIGSLILGVVLGGLITALLPGMGLDRLGGASSFVAMLAMLAIGVPMYVCASASTPIAVGLIAGGLSPGTALVFLLAGPATNIGSLLLLSKHLGKRVLVVYLSAIAVVSVLMGLWLDAAFGSTAMGSSAAVGLGMEAGIYTRVQIAGAVVLSILTILSLRRRRAFTHLIERVNRPLGLAVTPRQGQTAAALLLSAAYMASGFFIVGAGERAVVTRFGRITHAGVGSGLQYHWPYPLGAADLVSVAKTERVEVGFRSVVAPKPGPSTAKDGISEIPVESWALTGGQDIIDVKWVVQYRVKDSAAALPEYLYGTVDPRELVRSAAESAIRVAIGARGIDTLLTADRGAVESAVRESLRVVLDQCRSGVDVVHVGLLDVHAPAEVHWAFRDVAGAAEDQAKMVNEAYEYQERVVPRAEADRQKRALAAQGTAEELVLHAQGRAAAFAARLEAYRESPTVTAARLYLEAMDAVLPGLTKYVFLSEAVEQGVNLWWMDQDRRGFDMPPGPVSRGAAPPSRPNEVQP